MPTTSYDSGYEENQRFPPNPDKSGILLSAKTLSGINTLFMHTIKMIGGLA